jgi:hypothetical protein
MARLEWDKTGEHLYETGVDHGVLYFPDQTGAYKNGVAWNGLISVSESPSGAEATGQYADNIKYLNLISAEEFGATVEAYTYPEEFEACNGNKELVDNTGVYVGQQSRSVFGFCYRTMIGNDTDGQDHGYKLHLVYGCQVSPSEKAYQTINDSPEALTFSWELSTTPVNVTGKKPTALLVIDSTKIDSTKLTKIEAKLYGDATSTGAVLPTPDEIAEILNAT